MKKLILLEGLPGTGKTTISNWLTDLLKEQGENITLLLEFDERIPSNFYKTAGIPLNNFKNAASIQNTAVITENYAYLRIDKCPDYIARQIECWDMGDEYNQFIPVKDYITCALERVYDWTKKNTEGSEIVIIDSGFLQNPINELLFRKATDEDVRYYINNIANILKPLNPICIYLRRYNAEVAISFAKKIKGADWANGIDGLLKQDGFGDFFQKRFELELELLSSVRNLVCEIDEENWVEAKSKIKEYFQL